jgi:hypothetical protein
VALITILDFILGFGLLCLRFGVRLWSNPK